MNDFLLTVNKLLDSEPSTVQDAMRLLMESQNKQAVKAQLLEAMQKLDLEDLLDVLDLCFDSEDQIYQTEFVQLVLNHMQLSKELYEKLLKEHSGEQDLLSQYEFTSADSAAICTYLADLLDRPLLKGTVQLVLQFTEQFFAAYQEQFSHFYYQLAFKLIMKLHGTDPDKCGDLLRVAQLHSLQVLQPSSSVIQLHVVAFALELDAEQTQQTLLYLVNTALRSRDYLVAVIAAYCQVVLEHKVPLNKLFGHRLLAMNQNISAGLKTIISQLNYTVGLDDQAPQLLAQFLILQAKSDARVARLIGENEPFQQWLTELIDQGDLRLKELGKHLGNVVVRAGGLQSDWMGKIMKIIAGKEKVEDTKVKMGVK